MLVPADHSMIPQLTAIWAACFGDSPDYIAFFMAHRFDPQNIIVWQEDDIPVGASYLLPCSVEGTPCYYYYAVGVLPAYRGRGIGGSIMIEVERRCTIDGCFLLGSPKDGAHSYYHGRGMPNAFFCRWVVCSSHGTPHPIAPVEAQPKEYNRLRNQDLPQKGLVRWDDRAMDYALAEHRLLGGFAHIFPYEGRDYLLQGQLEERGLVILETTLSEGQLATLAPSLCAHYGGTTLICRLPGDESDVPTGFCYGHATWNTGWLGFDLT